MIDWGPSIPTQSRATGLTQMPTNSHPQRPILLAVDQ
jgi:hypothetical protein